MIPKYIEAKKDSWVMVAELPDGTLLLEGLRPSFREEDAFITHRIRFTREAVRQLLPLMEEWLDGLPA